jgi:SAM-dependent methyltransferase
MESRDEFRPDVPSPARIYDYLLGGKDNYPVDRKVAEEVLAEIPTARVAAVQNRAFLQRAVRYLVAEAGITQFLDLGSGLPSRGQVHQIAQAMAPESRVVYVDNDPVVLAHGRALLHGVDNTVIIRQDLRDPDAVLADPELTRLLDFGRPIGLLLVSVLHFIRPSEADPEELLRRFLAVLPAGSHLVLSFVTADRDEGIGDALERRYTTPSGAHPRSREQIMRFFAGMDLVEPGLVWLPDWRPDPENDPELEGEPADSLLYAAVARKR